MHAGTLSDTAQAALAKLGKSGIVKDVYLAGGSALALHLGHRKSYDFDFYTRLTLLVEDIAPQLAKIGSFKTTLLESPHTLLGEFEEVKISLFRYDYPLIDTVTIFKNITVAGVKDIAAMMLSAVTGRATKRDYVDLYILAKQFPLEKQFNWYRKKFGKLGNNLYAIIKALSYYEDAEVDEMPHMIKKVTWDEVKRFFTNESMRLAKKYLES